MPCRYDGPVGPSARELKLSRVLCCLDELNGRAWRKEWWQGYYPGLQHILSPDVEFLHTKTAELCSRLTKVKVSDYSLELQIWWRDHQIADRARIAKEQKELERQKRAVAARAKLTPQDLEALGLTQTDGL